MQLLSATQVSSKWIRYNVKEYPPKKLAPLSILGQKRWLRQIDSRFVCINTKKEELQFRIWVK